MPAPTISVGLAAGSPSPVPATPTPSATAAAGVRGGATTMGTVLGTGVGPASASYTGAVPFKGAAGRVVGGGFAVFVGLVGVVMVL